MEKWFHYAAVYLAMGSLASAAIIFALILDYLREHDDHRQERDERGL